MGAELDLTDTSHTVIIPGMAHLFKTTYVNKKTGKTHRPKKWYGRWKTESDKWVSKALSESKKIAQKMLMKYVREAEEAIVSPRRHSLERLIEQFDEVVKANSTKDYAHMLNYRVKKVIERIEATHPDHIEPGKVTIACAELADSLRTRSHYQASIKQFCKWLVNNGYAKRNPVADLKPPKYEADRRYVRRVLTQEEWVRLSQATESSKRRFRGLTGADRIALYRIVMATGWRAGGLAKLKVHNFLANGLVILEARHSKNRKEQRKFLPESVRKTTQDFLQEKSVNETVWPGNWYQNAAEMLRIDLRAAGIQHETGDGILDFHSFRNTSITWMLEAGTPIYIVQRHADHANPAQTMRYARPKRGDIDDAVEQTFSSLISLAQPTENKVSEIPEAAIIPANALKIQKGPREDA